MNRQIAALLALSSTVVAAPAPAEVELSFYTGFQEAVDSKAKGDDGQNDFDFTVDWEGKSADMPPYYGFRATWWRSERIGYGLEFNHAKVYASDSDRKKHGFDDLELTDGMNLFTANVFYRWPGQWASGRITPYVGGGLGFAMPHVDVERGDSDTFEYQVTGPAAIWVAGASWELNENWALFGEYKGSYSSHDIDLDNGGEMETDITTNAFNIGVSYSF
ncbi:outer membrane protein [Tropicimonas isoalkanivorans]|uniref:Lipid A oxidase n=1 Tax=Tropicimonas isoalkanivorans TaxID=441112 RepID=A0A1I1LTM7_9RHOB|nr:outer membrane beta-barrel protein [Tropicimonas isoalkanivorans]SFC76617.1 lipid A oxidase [Tropicimonas isoalkanivorans]